MANLGNYKGRALIHLDVLLNDGQQSALTTAASNPAFGAVSDEAIWELSAGSSITFYYYERSSNGNPPDNVIIRAYYETGTGLLVREMANSNVSSGTAFTFWATDDGTVTGAARTGTLRMYMRVSGGNGVTGTNYDVDSDGAQFALGGAYTAFDYARGLVRANAKVSDIAVSVYPAGSTFAYGKASDESLTLTATHTQPYAVRGHEHVRIDALDGTVQQIAGAEKDVGSGTTTTQQFTANSPNFDDAAKSYGAEFVPTGVAQLVPDSDPNMLWTTFVDDGVNVEQNGDNVRRQSFYNVDPRISFASVATGETIYNRGETASHQFELLNARSENLTRSVSWNIRDGAGTVLASTSDTGATYSNSRVIGDTERATPDTVGDQWGIITTLADAYNKSATIYKASRYWEYRETAGAAPGSVFTGNTASPDADDFTEFNRKHNVFFHGLLYNVRGEALGAVAGFFAPRRTDQEAYELSLVAHTLTASGEFTGALATYQVPLTSVTSPAGRALVFSEASVEQPRTGVGGQKNFAETDVSTPEWTITDQYQVSVHMNKALPFSEPPETKYTIAKDEMFARGDVLDVHGTPVENASVLVQQLNPSGVERQSGTGTTDTNGETQALAFDTRAPGGSGWIMRGTVDNHNGNTGTGDLGITMLSPFTADKALVTGFGPAFGVASSTVNRRTANPGDHAKPGDRILVGFSLTQNGQRVAVDASPAPAFMLAQFDQSDRKAYVLQSDFTWKNKDDAGYAEHYFDFKESIEGGLNWLAAFGTAGQGVTAVNGYVTDTSAWSPFGVFLIVRADFEGQTFYTGRLHSFAGPGFMHPMDGANLPDNFMRLADNGDISAAIIS